MTPTSRSTVPTRIQPALVALVIVLASFAVLPAVAAAQDVAPTDPTGPSATSQPELLVPGSSVPEGAGGTPTDTTLATTTTQAVPIGEGGVGITVTASTKVWAIIAALVTVAFLIASLTAVYWRHTRPTPSRIVSVGEDDIAPPEAPLDAPDEDVPTGDGRSVFA